MNPETTLIIFHYHLRPGGIRRIIELATPHLVRHSRGGIKRVILAVGEASDEKWNRSFKEQMSETAVEFFLEPAFHYLSEQSLPPSALTAKIRRALDQLFQHCSPANCLVWAHNLGIARNLILTRELARACARRKLPLAAHHHDWWFDNRWVRRPEMRRFGFSTLASAARAIFPSIPESIHISINRADANLLKTHFPDQAAWLPNLTEPNSLPDPAQTESARQWVYGKIRQKGVPIWIVPCRLLRRKNLAEALLLTRWLRPGAWLVTTGAASSSDEQSYAERLQAAARAHHWPLHLAILQGGETDKPGVDQLLAASETVLLTSIQEGFGLPYLEAAAAQRPLIARSIPNIAPDLKEFGFVFPYLYQEISVSPDLFDWPAEFARQQQLFRAWKQHLPRSCQQWAGTPFLLEAGPAPGPVPFSRLTLSAQLEILAQPLARSWEACAPLNPFLQTWRQQAVHSRLDVTPWPQTAAHWLSGSAYARRFHKLVQTHRSQSAPAPETAIRAQAGFIREKLHSKHLFPLLWTT